MTLKSPISRVEWYFLHEFGEKSTLIDFSPTSIKNTVRSTYRLILQDWKTFEAILLLTVKLRKTSQIF